MTFDTHKNLAQSFLTAVPVDRLDGTDFQVAPGDGFMFDANMPVTLCPPGADPSFDNAEIGYITAKDGDALTIARGQESSIRKSVAVDWIIFAGPTAKTVRDIEQAIEAHTARTDNPHATTKAQVGLSLVPNVDARDRATHTGTQLISTITNLQTILDSKATPASVAAAVAGLVGSSPATLDTLNELATALGNDPDFATTMTTMIGSKVSKAGDSMTGKLLVAAFEDTQSGFISVANAMGTRNINPRSTLSNNIGNSTAYYLNIYTQRHYFNSTAYIDGSSAGRLDVIGTLSAPQYQLNSNNGIMNIATSGLLRLSGGTIDDGAVIVMGGSTNGAVPNRGELRIGSTMIANWTTSGLVANTLGISTSLTLSSTTTGIQFYNTADQATNYERVRQFWSGNIFFFTGDALGAGASRAMRFGPFAAVGTGYLSLNPVSSSGFVQANGDSASAASIVFRLTGSMTAASGIQYGQSSQLVVNQSGAAGYVANFMNITETAIGSGLKLITDLQVNGVSRFSVGNGGNLFTSGFIGAGVSPGGAVIKVAASSTTYAAMRLLPGQTPSAPSDGDIWFDGADLKMRVGGATKTLTMA
jgi:hypothetical protein